MPTRLIDMEQMLRVNLQRPFPGRRIYQGKSGCAYCSSGDGYNRDGWQEKILQFGAYGDFRFSSESTATDTTKNLWFVEGHYFVFPWLIPYARYEVADRRHSTIKIKPELLAV